MKTKFYQLLIACLVAAPAFTSCSDDDDEYVIPTPPASQGSKMTLEGKVGNEVYANMVYVDLSTASQTTIDRKSWNLGFYCGSDYRVILNSSYATLATASDKTDFASVTLDDAQKAVDFTDTGMMGNTNVMDCIDAVDGDLTQTLFAQVSATASENKVYFVVSEDNKVEDRSLWYKVKVNRSTDGGYLVEYGKVSDKTPKVAEIAKDANRAFVGLSLENGNLVKLPEVKKWDLMWSYAAASTTMPNGRVIPGHSQDVITINNIGGVKVATLMTADCTYADCTLEKAKAAKFETAANVIGTTWRTPKMPNAEGGVKADRFYVFQDAEGNFYKLRFLKFGSGDSGERGKPELEFELLK